MFFVSKTKHFSYVNVQKVCFFKGKFFALFRWQILLNYLSRRRRTNHIREIILGFARLHVLVQNADLLHVVPAGRTGKQSHAERKF